MPILVKTSLHLASSVGCQCDAFAAKRRAAGACSTAPAAYPHLSIDISSRRTLSSKPTGRSIDGQTNGQTGRQTNTVPLHRPCSAYYVGSVNEDVYYLTALFVTLVAVIAAVVVAVTQPSLRDARPSCSRTRTAPHPQPTAAQCFCVRVHGSPKSCTSLNYHIDATIQDKMKWISPTSS